MYRLSIQTELLNRSSVSLSRNNSAENLCFCFVNVEVQQFVYILKTDLRITKRITFSQKLQMKLILSISKFNFRINFLILRMSELVIFEVTYAMAVGK
jgi:hypothetical protein